MSHSATCAPQVYGIQSGPDSTWRSWHDTLQVVEAQKRGVPTWRVHSENGCFAKHEAVYRLALSTSLHKNKSARSSRLTSAPHWPLSETQ